MKKNCWLVLGVMLSTSLLAQVANPPSAAPASAATTPTAVKAEKKKSARPAKKSTRVEKPVVLMPGAATITGSNVNVRGQATIGSEVVSRLNSGDAVTVIEQVIRDKAKPDEPTQWAKIVFPAGGHVWVHTTYIDPASKVVLPKRLNLRTGPGENYSVVGLIERGTPVREVSTKGSWIEIEAPATAFAFVAAQYLNQAATKATVPAIVSIAPPVTEPGPVTEPPPVTPPATGTVTPAPTLAPEPTTTTPPPPEEPLPIRIVSHEGVVRNTRSIQAPTKYSLYDPATGNTVNYLYTTSTNLDLSRWKGHRIIVTGEEGLDERWTDTPVITIQRIQVVQ